MGYAPRSPEDLDVLRHNTINAIVNLCAECYDLHTVQQAAGFDVFHIPLADESAPQAIDTLEPAFAWIDQHLEKDHHVLVHCRYGIGRTGTFVLAYLLYKSIPLDVALEKLDPTPSRPNSRAQWDFIEAYAQAQSIHWPKAVSAQASHPDEPGKFFRHIQALLEWIK